jgi:hypothetical protein
MNLKALTLALLLSSPLASSAQYPLNLPPIDPLQLQCKLRNDRFWTEIEFSLDVNGRVSGILGNYVFTTGGNRKFISGNILFDILSFDSAIIGHTGDPRGVVSRFSLVREEANQSRWTYEQTDPHGEKTVASFKCFPKTPPRR